MNNDISNPLIVQLRARIPGETFRLPSMGIFYNSGELAEDIKNGEVHCYPLTTIDEIILATPDKLLNGKAVEEVFLRCIPQIKKPMKLLQKDVDFLLMCLRSLSYGPNVEITHKHDCKDAKDHTYTVPIQPVIKSTKSVDPTTLEQRFAVYLEDTSQVVNIHPPIYENVIHMYQKLVLNKQIDDEESQREFLNTYANLISSVDGINDKKLIIEWLEQLPGKSFNKITEAVQKSGDWGIDTIVVVRCKDCGADIKLNVDTNPISFFI